MIPQKKKKMNPYAKIRNQNCRILEAKDTGEMISFELFCNF
jgi:hypothetical protein